MKAAKILKQSRENGDILDLHNESGNNNQELQGRFIYPFWFKNKKDYKRILLMYDNASAHTFGEVMKHAKKELEERKMENLIPKNHLPFVANTTFATQLLDCGVNKSFKSIYRKKSYK